VKPHNDGSNRFWWIELSWHPAVLVKNTGILDPDQMLGQRLNGFAVKDCAGDSGSMTTGPDKVGNLVFGHIGQETM
jgi:hypothetical protein